MKPVHTLLLVMATLLSSLSSVAMPAIGHLFTAKQTDGTTVSYYLRGDEYGHCHFTTDGVPIARSGSDDNFCYVIMSADGTLQVSEVIAHEAGQRSEAERELVSLHSQAVSLQLQELSAGPLQEANKRRSARAARPRRALGDPTTYVGSFRGLVILVNFSDRVMVSATPQPDFNLMFNQPGYQENGAIGSVRDYFLEQSYGQFYLNFDVVGPYTLKYDMSYYGSNQTEVGGSDKKAYEMVVEACKQADADVNFADYDWDGDGEVDQVFIVYAGYGESNGAPGYTIWPHESHLQYYDCGIQSFDGVNVNTYACACELAGTRGTTPNGIGTACHEFSHCLGLPDFYDTGYNGGFGMSYYSLMASGGHSGPSGRGEVPSGYTAYERWFAGWLELQELNEPCQVADMPCIAEKPVAYRVSNDGCPDEYFILENHQKGRWFSYLSSYEAGHGLLITHVDYDAQAWHSNKVNRTVAHQRMTIIPADNSYGTTYSYGGNTYYSLTRDELTGDFFPGTMCMTRLTNTSHTKAGGTLYNRNTDGSYCMNKDIDNISEHDGLINFDFMGGIYLPTPQVTAPDNISKTGFTFRWMPVDGADSYTLEIEEREQMGPPSEHLLLSESMKKLRTYRSADGYEDLSSQLDNYMENPGWEGYKVFTSNYGAKVGTVNAEGYMLSPRLMVGKRNLTVRADARAYLTSGATLQVILDPVADTNQQMQSVTLTNSTSTSTISFQNIENGQYRLRFTSPQRFYLCSVAIYDGLYTEEDFNEDTRRNTHGVYPQGDIYHQLISDITDTTYTFSHLRTTQYYCRVKAVSSTIDSRWSDYMLIDLTDASAVKAITDDKNETSLWYSALGQRTNTRRKGIYIRKNGMRTTKHIIR